MTKFVSPKNLRNLDKTNSSSISFKQSKEHIKAELNKDNATSTVTGFVNLLSVLEKLTNKIKINKAVTRGIILASAVFLGIVYWEVKFLYAKTKVAK